MHLESRFIKLFALFMAATISGVVGDDLDVYVDASLATGWENWSWSSTINFAATDIVSGSSGSSISVTSDAWAALSLYNPAPFKTYAGLKFDIAVRSYFQFFSVIHFHGLGSGGSTRCYSFDSIC